VQEIKKSQQVQDVGKGPQELWTAEIFFSVSRTSNHHWSGSQQQQQPANPKH